MILRLGKSFGCDIIAMLTTENKRSSLHLNINAYVTFGTELCHKTKTKPSPEILRNYCIENLCLFSFKLLTTAQQLDTNGTNSFRTYNPKASTCDSSSGFSQPRVPPNEFRLRCSVVADEQRRQTANRVVWLALRLQPVPLGESIKQRCSARTNTHHAELPLYLPVMVVVATPFITKTQLRR